jgi:tyrosine-protein phosphatase YwqE
MGAYLQLNFDRLGDHDSFFRRNPWKKLVNDGYVDFLGSDTHGVKFRPLHVEEALTKGSSGMDMEMLDRILGQNVRKLKRI